MHALCFGLMFVILYFKRMLIMGLKSLKVPKWEILDRLDSCDLYIIKPKNKKINLFWVMI
jgi:hypothetical protein